MPRKCESFAHANWHAEKDFFKCSAPSFVLDQPIHIIIITAFRHMLILIFSSFNLKPLSCSGSMLSQISFASPPPKPIMPVG